MNPLLLHAARDARRRPVRAALAFAGVVLGVAAMVATAVATRAASAAYRDMYESLAGKAALEVAAEGGGGFDEALATRLGAIPGVAAAVPVVRGQGALVSPGPRTPVVVLGVPEPDPARDVTVVEGTGVGRGEGVVLLAPFARARGVHVGGAVRLVTAGGTWDAPVVGLATAPSLASFPGAVVLAALPEAQRRFGLGGRVHAVELVLAAGAREEDVRERVTAALPAGLRVERPAQRGVLAEASLASTDQGLAAVSMMALVAAVFVILNAFSMNLAERRRDLATMRAIGAERRQVASALVTEAVVLGVVGTLVGVGVGLLGARVIAAGMETMLGVPLPPPAPAWGPIALALVVGPAATIGATLLPARRAARRDPLRDLMGSPEALSEPVRRASAVAGFVLVALTLVATVLVSRGLIGPEFIAPGVACGMLGGALAFPAVLPWLRRAAVALLSPVVGPAGRLGLVEVERRPVHTTLSSTVLFVAVMGGVGMGNEILSSIEDVRDWTRSTLVEDYFLRATMPESGTMTAAPLSDAVGLEIDRLPDTLHANRIRFVPAVAGGVPVVAIVRTFPEGEPLRLTLRETLGGTPPRGLKEGEAILGTALAGRLGIAPGDEIVLSARAGPLRLRVVATATEYTAGGHALYLSWATGKSAFGQAGADAFMVDAKPGRRSELKVALGGIAAREGLLLQSNADLHQVVEDKTAGVVGLLWTALAVVFLVASLGVVNTLTTNVLDQTREIGVLRAVGTTRAQVAGAVLAQALTIAVVGLVPGIVAGVGLSRLLNACVEPVRGFPIPFHLDVPLLLYCAGAALLVAALAAVLPAVRAARLPVTEALHYE